MTPSGLKQHLFIHYSGRFVSIKLTNSNGERHSTTPGRRPISLGRAQILSVEHFGDDLALVSLLDLA
jgi:hypothetical protein